ncbi:hypothetical protein D3C87_1884360 [compost metagenome]
MSRSPVDIFGIGVGADRVHRVSPAVQRLVGAEPACDAREQVAVRRHEAGRDVRSPDIEHLCLGIGHGRTTRTGADDHPVLRQQPSLGSHTRLVGHVDEEGIGDE